eukprot:236234-Chlamydomonas_euryale.AAC.1
MAAWQRHKRSLALALPWRSYVQLSVLAARTPSVGLRSHLDVLPGGACDQRAIAAESRRAARVEHLELGGRP